MQGQTWMRKIVAAVLLSVSLTAMAEAPGAAPVKAAVDAKPTLKFVVIVTRHGVRSPTGKLELLNHYSRQPWPAWSVLPGYLTVHGARLMTMFGAYDRELYASEGLLAPEGCADAAHIRIVADSEQRTRETGKALAAGLAPDCALSVTYLAEATPDPLFHPLAAGVGPPDKQLAMAAVAGRIGANPRGLSEAYRAQFLALEEVLGCGAATPCTGKDTEAPHSLFEIPARIGLGKGDHPFDLSTPLSLASTITENLLLEYIEGKDSANVGWGRVDADKLRYLLQLHVAAEDISLRTSYIARAQSSNLLDHLLRSMRQAASGRAVAGALTRPDDRLLILVGHDTNQASMAGALSLNWLADGRRDDTPPGGALVFELWQTGANGPLSVRTYYTAQTLDQMRNSTPLSLAAGPERVPVFVPGCGRADGSCAWDAFAQTLAKAIDPAFVQELSK